MFVFVGTDNRSSISIIINQFDYSIWTNIYLKMFRII